MKWSTSAPAAAIAFCRACSAASFSNSRTTSSARHTNSTAAIKPCHDHGPLTHVPSAVDTSSLRRSTPAGHRPPVLL
jgi:hypothetical protein